MPGYDRPREREHGRTRVHHAGPLAELGLPGWRLAEDVGHAGGWEADEGAAEDAEKGDEAHGAGEGGGQSPENQDKKGADGGDDGVDLDTTDTTDY